MAVENDPLHGPEEPDGRDRQRARHRDPRPEPGAVAEPAHRQEREADHEELARIDPEVETQERDDEVVLRERHVAQAAGKPQAVDEAEPEDDGEPPGPEPGPE